MRIPLLVEAFLRLIYPAGCEVCRAVLELNETSLCRVCRDKVQASRYSNEETSDLKISFVRQAWALYPYKSPVREILAGLKFQHKPWLAEIFDQDFSSLSTLLPPDLDVAVPIPMDWGKRLQREFNQSEILARKSASALGIPYCPALRKTGSTPAQNGLSRKDRELNLAGIFELKSGARIRGKKVLLVDDVLTTGATAREAARVLKENGASGVFLLTAARTEIREGAR